jgi:septation ring formation regulator EzrA
MRTILLTNWLLQGRTGTEMYVRDLALALKRRGHRPMVFTLHRGAPAEELSGRGIPVVDNLEDLPWEVEVVHGHHNFATVLAMLACRRARGLFVCHDAKAWHDKPPSFPRLMAYAGVDDLCRERVATSLGMSLKEVRFIGNSVDLARFQPRGLLPERPRRAVIFSNYASEHTFLPIVREACQREGLELDVIGSGVQQQSSEPERVLGNYDVVFGRARCAMEALATGCATILCGTEGAGPLVTLENFDRLRRDNFGRRCLSAPLSAEHLAAEIRRYDAASGSETARHARSRLDLEETVDQCVALYEELLARPCLVESEAEAWAAAAMLTPPLAQVFKLVSSSTQLELNARRVTETHDALQQEYARLQAHAGHVTEANDALQQEYARLHEHVRRVTEAHGTLQEAYGAVQEENSRLQEHVRHVTEAYGAVQEEDARLQEHVRHVTEAYGAVQEEDARLQEHVRHVTEAYGALQEEYAALQQHLSRVTQAYDALQQEYARIEDAHSALREESVRLQEHASRVTEAHEILQQEYARLGDHVRHVTEAHDALQQENLRLRDDMRQATEARDALEADNASLQAQSRRLAEIHHALQSEVQSLKETTTRQSAELGWHRDELHRHRSELQRAQDARQRHQEEGEAWRATARAGVALTGLLAWLWERPELRPLAELLGIRESPTPEFPPHVASSPAPMPVVVGAPRSGTTLLRFMLDAHPDLAIPPETSFLVEGAQWSREPGMTAERFVEALTHFPPEAPNWADFAMSADDLLAEIRALPRFDVAEAFRCFYRLYARRLGKARWGEKTPGYGMQLDQLATLLPEARFVHLIRDGRDVALSWRQVWFAPSQEMRVLGEQWANWVSTTRHLGRRAAHYLEVRYEELIMRPAETLRRICDFVELEFHPAMLEYHKQAPARLAEHQGRTQSDGTPIISQEKRLAQQSLLTHAPSVSRVSAWRKTMTESERRDFEETAGALLTELGYNP